MTVSPETYMYPGKLSGTNNVYCVSQIYTVRDWLLAISKQDSKALADKRHFLLLLRADLGAFGGKNTPVHPPPIGQRAVAFALRLGGLFANLV